MRATISANEVGYEGFGSASCERGVEGGCSEASFACGGRVSGDFEARCAL